MELELKKHTEEKSVQELLSHILSVWNNNEMNFRTKRDSIAYYEFLYSFNGCFTRCVVNETLTEMQRTSNNSLSKFYEIYCEINKKQKGKQSTDMNLSFYLPIDAEFEDDIELPILFTILGVKISFTSKIPKKYLSQINDSLFKVEESLRKEIKEYLSDKTKIFIKISTCGKTAEAAWEKISLPFSVLRGIIEFSFNLKYIIFSQKNGPRAIIQYPQWTFIFKDDSFYSFELFDIIKYNSVPKFKFTKKHLEIIKKNAKMLNKQPCTNSTMNVLINCLRLYSEAMNEFYYHSQFLGFWQIAEAICVSDDFGGKTDEVVKRIAWFAKDAGLKSSGNANILRVLAQKRNALVHNGTSDINYNAVNLIKIAVDIALRWLFKNVKEFKTESHLKEYYRMRAWEAERIAGIKEALKFINKSH